MDILGKLKRIIPHKETQKDDYADNFPAEAKEDINAFKQQHMQQRLEQTPSSDFSQNNQMPQNNFNNANNFQQQQPMQNQYSQIPRQSNNFQNQNYSNLNQDTRGVPFEEPAPPSLDMGGNSPELEKLDSVMIELRNIKAQNVQILNEMRLMQDRLRRTY